MTPCISQATTLSTPFEHDLEAFGRAGWPAVELWLTKLETYLQSISDDSDPHDVDQMGDIAVSTLAKQLTTPAVEEVPIEGGPSKGIGISMQGTPMAAEEIDRIACPENDGGPCSFLVPIWLGEQETKAQVHLHQLGMLALSLNRTLVLPNVARSRIGTCNTMSFDAYYDVNSLERLGVRSIRQYDFLAWSLRRVPRPSGQLISMVNAKSTYPRGAMEIDSTGDPGHVPSKASRGTCLAPPRGGVDFSRHSPLSVYPPDGFHKLTQTKLNFGESLINTIRSSEVEEKSLREGDGALTFAPEMRLPASVDVVALNYEMRYGVLTPELLREMDDLPEGARQVRPFAHFGYAMVWRKLAEEIAQYIGPFIAVHWRQETLPVTAIAPCAESLKRALIDAQQRFPTIQTVYLSTDYPLEMADGTKSLNSQGAHSGTFVRLLTEDHHEAMRGLVGDFEAGSVNGLRLSTFSKISQAQNETKFEPSPDLADMLHRAGSADLNKLDPGLLGIIEKMIVANAEVFVSGFFGPSLNDPSACGKESSFTRQIWKIREYKMLDQRERLGLDLPEPDSDPEADDQEPTAPQPLVELQPGMLWNVVDWWDRDGLTDRTAGAKDKVVA